MKNNYINYKSKYLEIIGIDKNKKINGEHVWIGKCICGKIFNIVSSRVKNIITCGCKSSRTNVEFDKYLAFTPKDIYDYWRIFIPNAKKRNIEIQITPQYAYDLFIKQNKRCALTGIKIFLQQPNINRLDCASLDRIDSNLPYNTGNVQWVHKKVNLIKNKLSTEELLYWSELITKNTYLLHYSDNINTINKIPQNYFYRIKYYANDRNIFFNLSKQDMLNKLRTQKFRCRYTKLPIDFKNKTASLDRRNPLFGYTNTNIEWVHKQVNTMKLAFQEQEFYSYCNNVYEFYTNPNSPNIIRWQHEPVKILRKISNRDKNSIQLEKTDLYPNVW